MTHKRAVAMSGGDHHFMEDDKENENDRTRGMDRGGWDMDWNVAPTAQAVNIVGS